MYTKIFVVAATLLVVGFGCSDMPKDQQVDYEEDIKPLIEEKSTGKVRGSCNMIDKGSKCLDYIGSLWTEQQMRLNCQGGGDFSLNACPYAELGGCRNAKDTITENIIWTYNYGGEPSTPESLPYERGACDILEISEWTYPADMLEKKQ